MKEKQMTGVIYAEFREESGPVPKKYIPKGINPKIPMQVAVASLTSSFMGEKEFTEPKKGFQVFPLLRYGQTVFSLYFTLSEKMSGGGFIPATLNLVLEGEPSREMLKKIVKALPKLERILEQVKETREIDKEDYMDLHKTLTGRKVPETKIGVKARKVAFESAEDVLRNVMPLDPSIQSLAIVSRKGEILQGIFPEEEVQADLKKIVKSKISNSAQRIGEEINEQLDNLTVKYKKRSISFSSLKGGKKLVSLMGETHGLETEVLLRQAASRLNELL